MAEVAAEVAAEVVAEVVGSGLGGEVAAGSEVTVQVRGWVAGGALTADWNNFTASRKHSTLSVCDS